MNPTPSTTNLIWCCSNYQAREDRIAFTAENEEHKKVAAAQTLLAEEAVAAAKENLEKAEKAEKTEKELKAQVEMYRHRCIKVAPFWRRSGVRKQIAKEAAKGKAPKK